MAVAILSLLVAGAIAMNGVVTSLAEMERLAGDPDAAIPPLMQSPGRRIALLVEPTPFTHVSGYSNRFREMLRYLQAGGDEVEIITPDDTADRPADFLGMPIRYVRGFRLFVYKQVQLTVDLGLKGYAALKRFKPTLIHAVTPGIFVVPAIAYARLLDVPLVISYHTHLPFYAEKYVRLRGLRGLVVAFCKWFVPATLNHADVALATSPQLKAQLEDLGCRRGGVWRKGVDSQIFNPAFNVDNERMRATLSGGQPEAPILSSVTHRLHVGYASVTRRVHVGSTSGPRRFHASTLCLLLINYMLLACPLPSRRRSSSTWAASATRKASTSSVGCSMRSQRCAGPPTHPARPRRSTHR